MASIPRRSFLSLADDSFGLGWENGSDLFAKHLDPFGSFTAGNFLSDISQDTTDPLRAPQFAQQANSEAVVFYNEDVSGNLEMVCRSADSSFSSTDGGTVVASSANDEEVLAASSSATGSAIVYTDSSVGQHLLVAFLSSNGILLSNGIIPHGGATTIQTFPAMESIANGDVATVYTDFSVASGSIIRMLITHRDPTSGGLSAVGAPVVSGVNVLGTNFAAICHDE